MEAEIKLISTTIETLRVFLMLLLLTNILKWQYTLGLEMELETESK